MTTSGDLGIALVAVRGEASQADAVAERLAAMGAVGSVIDGAALGLPDWVLARVAGTEDGVLVAASADEDPTLVPHAEVRAALAESWSEVQVGEVVIDRRPLEVPLGTPSGPVTSVAVTPRASLMLGVMASSIKAPITEAPITGDAGGDRLLVGLDLDDEAADRIMLDALSGLLTNAKGRSVVIWRRGPHWGLHVLRRGKHVLAHVWEPQWRPFGHAGLDHVRAGLRPIEADAADVAELLEVPAERLPDLRVQMRQAEPDLTRLAELLALPDEAVRVLAGELAVADLPGAVVHEPGSRRAAVRQAMAPSEHDPAWVQRVDASRHRLSRGFLIVSAVFIVLCGVISAILLADGSVVPGLLVLAAGVVRAAMVAVRWRRQQAASRTEA